MVLRHEGYAELVRGVRLRAQGIENHLTTVGRVGLTQTDAEEGGEIASRIEQLEAEQAALRAALKLKTAELHHACGEAQVWRSRATKLLKVAFAHEQPRWVEFGIRATR